MARRVKGIIERDPMEKIGFDAYEHEIPILQAVHGSSRVKVFAEHPDYDSGEPAYDDGRDLDPAAEYARLARHYGDNVEVKAPWVQYVYGLEMSGRFAGVVRNVNGSGRKRRAEAHAA